MAPCGIHAVCFELGGFKNTQKLGFGGDNGKLAKLPQVPEYQAAFGSTMDTFFTEVAPTVPGDTKKVSQAVIDVIKGEGLAKGRKWSVRVCLGPDSAALVRQKCNEQLQLCDEWDDVTGSVVRDDWSGQVSPHLLNMCTMIPKVD